MPRLLAMLETRCPIGTKGSWEIFGRLGKDGRTRPAMRNDNRKTKAYTLRLQIEAQEYICKNLGYDFEPVTGPIGIQVFFFFKRPKSHFGTGKNAGKLRPSAPATYKYTKPDLDKALRALLDAFSNVLYHDDGQVVKIAAECRYHDDPDKDDLTTLWVHQIEQFFGPCPMPDEEVEQ